MKRSLSWLLLLLAILSPTGAPAGTPAPDGAEAVVLLHGLGRTDRSMRSLERRLREAGFQVHNLRYDSTRRRPEVLVAALRSRVHACCREASTLHFVGHSLGGVLIRAYLADETPSNLGRVVLLAPPNHGSELVDVFGDSPWFRWALGPAASQLGTSPESFPNRLPPATFEVGVIAGTASVNPLGSVLLPGDDDGVVSVASTRLEGMVDFLVVRDSHTFIRRSPEVGDQVVRFLRRGRFRHEAPE